MKKRTITLLLAAVLVLSLVACGGNTTATPTPPAEPANTATPTPTPTPDNTETPAPETPVDTEPGLIVGVLYGGPITDAGYNQAMHDSMMVVQQNIPGIKLIEAENVPDEAGATSTMENMINEGAKLIIASAFNHQYPAVDLAGKYPDVKFEHVGGWEVRENFGNFFGTPPDTWYLMGIAAGMMTETNKLGFVAAFPMGWTATFINSYTLGAQSVNPNVQTIVAYTFNWGDRAKEADTTNSLINQSCDVITMHVDSPATVVSTAESRGVYSIGYQSLEAQQFAPEYWITGAGFTFGDKLTWVASTVIDGTWKPMYKRWNLAEGAMSIAPFGPTVPQEVKDAVNKATDELNAGNIVVFKGPIKDQEGNIKVAEGEVLTDDLLSATDWFVEGVIGQAS